MTETNLYAVQTVGVTEEQWFEDGDDSSPPIRSEKRYHLHSALFTAPDAETVYHRVKEIEEGGSDCNHDGEGHKTLFYNLGIHDIELCDYPLEKLLEHVQGETGSSVATFTTADVDENGIPLIRAKHELSIFRRP